VRTSAQTDLTNRTTEYTQAKRDSDTHRTQEPVTTRATSINQAEEGRSAKFRTTVKGRVKYSSRELKGYLWDRNRAWTTWDNEMTRKDSTTNTAETAKNRAQATYNTADLDLTRKTTLFNDANTRFQSALSARNTRKSELSDANSTMSDAEDTYRTALDKLDKAEKAEKAQKAQTGFGQGAGSGGRKGGRGGVAVGKASAAKGGTKGRGKGKAKGKAGKKGKKGKDKKKKDESLFRILGRDLINEIKNTKKYNK
jgi:chromosome segregation ATPase